MEYGGELTGGEPRSSRFWTHCGMEWLGMFNGEEWLLSGGSPDDDVPSGWDSYKDAAANEEIVLRLELTDDGTVTARPVDAPTDQEVESEPTAARTLAAADQAPTASGRPGNCERPRATASNDDVYDLVMHVAADPIEIDELACRLRIIVSPNG